MAKYVATGAAIGVIGVLLAWAGNPAHSGLCVSCFLENIAGALALHDNVRMQYLRPELLGLVLGAFIVAAARRQLRPVAGGSPLLRFVVGALLIVGCAVFIGCPIKMVLRLAAGDLTALFGLAGLAAGVWVGIRLAQGGFRTGRQASVPAANALLVPAVALVLVLFVFLQPTFVAASVKGAAAQRAPALLALIAGLALGALAQPTRFCITAGLARLFLWGPGEIPGCPKTAGLLAAVGSFFASALVASVLSGQFALGLEGQPSSNDSYGWAFLAMAMVGFGSVLIRGCPFRQLVMAGEGDADAAIAVAGMLAGAAVVQRWGLGGNAAGTPYAAKMAVLVGLGFLFVVSIAYRDRAVRQ